MFHNLAFVLLLALAPCAGAVTVQHSRLSDAVDQRTCAAPKSVSVFQPVTRQVFLWFLARDARPGDQLRVDWVDPAGAVSTSAQYGELPAAPEICFTTQLPVAGFAPAAQPGKWTVRVTANGRALLSKEFEIAAGAPAAGGPQVTSVTWTPTGANQIDIAVRGAGFEPGAAALIATYTATGGWQTIASLQPGLVAPGEIRAHYGGLPASEYLLIVRNPDQRTSRPMPFTVATSGYKLPTAGGEPWVLTQGPHGAFSHWGNSTQAYDIAPRSGRNVVAMRGGVAHTFDRGMTQDQRRRTFGNYITIDHGDGEYSHYAHLAAGTFAVADGERVEQGQALAMVGNSGYTLGEGGGYHVHVHVTRSASIAAQSIPFAFEDLPAPRGGAVVESRNFWQGSGARTGARVAAAAPAPPKQFSGSVAVEQWWTGVVAVRARAKAFEAWLGWKSDSAGLDLHLVSPSGKHYGWYGDTTGYSGAQTNPQRFRVPHPEPGLWRVSVQAVRGGAVPIDFDVSTTGTR